MCLCLIPVCRAIRFVDDQGGENYTISKCAWSRFAVRFVSWTTEGVKIILFVNVLDPGLPCYSFRGWPMGVKIILFVNVLVLDPDLPCYSFRGWPRGWKLYYFQMCLIPVCRAIRFVDNRRGENYTISKCAWSEFAVLFVSWMTERWKLYYS